MRAAYFSILVLSFACAQDDFKIVNIDQGPVKGYKVQDYGVFAFYGIPYASAPTGRDKFKAPLPPPKWTDTFEAINEHIYCPQYGLLENSFVEDCLIASVYIPDTDATNLPVVFLVHGGGFQVGYGNSRTPKQFVNYKKNVIVVTFNYRVGPHGFLCLGTPDVPGNAGMKDQVAALKWTKDNIAAFGGNPNDITIAGCSAGGASVDLLILSNTTEGLYKRVIGQSGANIGAFAVQVDPTENARNYASLINYNGPDRLADLEEFYKNISYKQLAAEDLGSTKDVAVVFSACVERDLGNERFLDDTPINILKKGNYVRYPMLYGWADMEGLYRVQLFENWKNAMNEDFSQFIPADLKFNDTEHKNEVAKKVKEFYFGDAPVRNDDILDYINFNTDVMFVVAMQRAVTMQVEAGNDAVFASVYSYVNKLTPPIPYTTAMGATHCTQMNAVLDETESLLSSEDVAMKQTMRDLWLNFIYTGEPTPEGKIPSSMPKWEPVKADRTPCMDLGNTIQVLSGPFAKERQEFWDDIYDRFHRDAVPPYDF